MLICYAAFTDSQLLSQPANANSRPCRLLPFPQVAKRSDQGRRAATNKLVKSYVANIARPEASWTADANERLGPTLGVPGSRSNFGTACNSRDIGNRVNCHPILVDNLGCSRQRAVGQKPERLVGRDLGLDCKANDPSLVETNWAG